MMRQSEGEDEMGEVGRASWQTCTVINTREAYLALGTVLLCCLYYKLIETSNNLLRSHYEIFNSGETKAQRS